MALKKLVDKENIQEGLRDIQKARKEFIRKGGQVFDDLKTIPIKDEWNRIIIRIKKEAIMMIDEIVGNTMGLTRTGWILQAIEEKLKKRNE